MRDILWRSVFLFSLIVLLAVFSSKVYFSSSALALDRNLTHGPVIGNVSDTSATIFIRTNRIARVQIKYSQDPQLSDFQLSPVVVTSAAPNHTVKITLDSLMPSTKYYFDVLVADVPQLSSPYPAFKTFPSPATRTNLKIVQLTDFCCFKDYYPPQTQTFLNASLENPDLVILGGDFDHRNPYGPTREDTLRKRRKMFKDLYTPVTNMGVFVNQIMMQYPVAHMWDDHDFATNNSDKTYPYKDASLQVLNEYFPTYPMSQYGDWQKFRLGQAEFFLLDSRSQRDPKLDTDNANKSMLDGDNLGAAGQLEWLKQGLLNSTATWKFIVSPVVFNPTQKKIDAWAGYLTERQSILQFVKQNNIKNIIVISGDAHGGGIDSGVNSGFPEMLVTQANLPSGTDVSCFTALQIGTWSEGIYGNNSTTACQGYGVIEVLTNPDRVVLTEKDDKGATKITYTVPFSP